MTTGEIAVVGSLNADLTVRVPRFPAPGETISGDGFAIVPGGKGANQAAAAGRLGGRVAMIGQVGADAQGALLREALQAAGVDTRLVAVDESAATGVAVITIDAHGENEIILAAGANGTFAPERLAPALGALRSARVVLLQLEIPLATVLRAAAEARSAGAVVILDPAPAIPIPDQLLSLADYVTPNERELAILVGGTPTGDDTPLDAVDAMARTVLARGAARVLVKLGARGARLVAPEMARSWPARQVHAVDTTAAGDAFNGALAAALTEGASLDQAVRFATTAASISVTRAGAQPSLPTRSEVEAVLQGRWLQD
jgi:ribokinase